MGKTNERLIAWLFQSGALKVSPFDKPFWYTSGTLGPYYINTHYLFGGEDAANELLGFIDSEKKDWESFAGKLENKLIQNYNNNKVFQGVADILAEIISSRIGLDKIRYISGGERRDWFFAPIAAVLTGKPYILIYKDMQMTLVENGQISKVLSPLLESSDILHIADLITEASSYQRQWLPAIRGAGGRMLWSCVVVDRMQGGSEYLADEGVTSYSLVSVDCRLFDTAFSLGLINDEQHTFIRKYLSDPRKCMKDFLSAHPSFLENELKSNDVKIRERARMCFEKGIYGQLP